MLTRSGASDLLNMRMTGGTPGKRSRLRATVQAHFRAQGRAYLRFQIAVALKNLPVHETRAAWVEFGDPGANPCEQSLLRTPIQEAMYVSSEPISVVLRMCFQGTTDTHSQLKQQPREHIQH